jgi:hypothetical protein
VPSATASTNDLPRLDCALEAAVVAHWNDLMPDSPTGGAMEIVYGTSAEHTLHERCRSRHNPNIAHPTTGTL